MASPSSKRILVAPLDWGLGHAARCVPIVRRLLERGHEVVIAGSHPLLSEVFPGLLVLPLVRYDITYGASPTALILKFPFMVSRVLMRARQEHRQLEALIRKHRIDAVISDQRFGCYTRLVPCAYISHQFCVKMSPGFGLLESLLARALRFAAGRFDALWIPDVPGSLNLTGDLTRKYPLPKNHRFIGMLSRLGEGAVAAEICDLLVMISGPEPQRTIFEKQVLSRISGFSGKAVILLGRPGTAVTGTFPPNIMVHAHLAQARIEALMKGANAIVCRGGYTTIMELAALNKKAVLIPTPGQTEQEYLCERLSEAGWFASMTQAEFDLQAAMALLKRAQGAPVFENSRPLLTGALQSIGL
jgi:hypothetical protein